MPEIPADGQFASFFDDLLTRLHLSNAAAARRLRVAQSQVGRWRRGEGGISKDNLRRIHEEFGIDLNYLFSLAGLHASATPSELEAIEAERQAHVTPNSRRRKPTKPARRTKFREA